MLVFMHTSPFANDAVKDPYHAPQTSFAMPTHTNYTPELIHYAEWALKKMYKPGYRYMKCGLMLTDLVQEGKSQANDVAGIAEEGSNVEDFELAGAKKLAISRFDSSSESANPWAGDGLLYGDVANGEVAYGNVGV